METSQEIARSILHNLRDGESSTTKAMGDLANHHNGYLTGLEFRMKSFDFLVRRIETDSLLDDVSFSEAGKGICDALPYTTIFSKETFARDYLDRKNSLLEQGYEIVKVKNTWLDDGPYKGVNAILLKDGFTFEMQYHTEGSFALKNGLLHELYEERRLPSTSRERKLELDKQMVKLSRQLEVPADIERVK